MTTASTMIAIGPVRAAPGAIAWLEERLEARLEAAADADRAGGVFSVASAPAGVAASGAPG
ncbi:MAG: hypothetical protein B7Y45_12145 [Sphingomonas sp. 28-66-16]|nr:MAG: hypothetical protein B7Y45_12145 [Sphingomonas sp. 28-66-16]